MTSTQEARTAAAATDETPKPTKKAGVGKRARNVASGKAKSGKSATPTKKTPKGAKKATGARDGSKAAQILDLLKRSGGASTKELLKATGWQPHSLRGFLSGTVRKKLGLSSRPQRARTASGATL